MIPSGRTYHDLIERWRALDGRHGLRIGGLQYGEDGWTLLHARSNDWNLPAVGIAAGVHGDEPAGPWALLSLVEEGLLSSSCSYRLWPCTNPCGYIRGRRTNFEGQDINRTFGVPFVKRSTSHEAEVVLSMNATHRFALSLDLHEDCDAEGFYCYEYGDGGIGPKIIAALDEHGLPIDPLEVTFALAGPLEEAYCRRERGLVVADAGEEAALLGGLSYSLAMARHGARHALTFETPLSAPWPTRIAMHRLRS